jgi:hypothetical protein
VQAEPAPEATSRPGATVLIDILIAPARAFATIAVKRPILPAILVMVACNVASNVLMLPAIMHVAGTKTIDPNERLAIASSALLQLVLLVYSWSIVASIFANLAAGDRSKYWTRYRTFFSLAANAAIPSQLGTLAEAITVRLHPAEQYHTLAQIANALPFSLAIFATPNNAREVTFLSSFDLTTVWSILLVAFGAHAIGGIRLTPALVVPCAIALGVAFLYLFI